MLDIFQHEPEIRAFAPGEFLFRQGDDPVHHMFAILEGEVEIDRDGRVLAKLGPSSSARWP